MKNVILDGKYRKRNHYNWWHKPKLCKQISIEDIKQKLVRSFSSLFLVSAQNLKIIYMDTKSNNSASQQLYRWIWRKSWRVFNDIN